MTKEISVGSVVRTGVYVIGEWRPMWLGTVTAMSDDGTLATVDVGTMHGCARNEHVEQTSHLRLETANA